MDDKEVARRISRTDYHSIREVAMAIENALRQARAEAYEDAANNIGDYTSPTGMAMASWCEAKAREARKG